MNTKFKIGEKVVYKSEVYNVSRIIINQYTICYQIDNTNYFKNILSNVLFLKII